MTQTARAGGYDVVILGGGVIGMWSAWQLAERGASVAIIDAALRGQASVAGGGILAPIPPTEFSDNLQSLLERSLELYPKACERLHSETGISPEYWRSGCWLLNETLDAGPSEHKPSWLIQASAAGIPEFASRAQRRSGSHWLPSVGQIRPPRLLDALRIQCRKRGVDWITGHADAFQTLSASAIQVTLRDGNTVRGQQLVVCAGAWVRELVPELKVIPVAGQMLALDAGQHCPSSIVIDSGKYLIPRRDGIVVLGSSLHPGSWDLEPRDADTTALLTFAANIVPALADLPVLRRWSGLRPAFADFRDMPLIQTAEDRPNLHWAVGHYRLGLSLAPATAERVSALVLN